MKILVADDDHASRRLVSAFLTRADYEVVAAESGEAALEAMLTPEPPIIAIIDWVMPGMNGPDVVTRLRNAPSKIRPYLILLSAKNDKASIAEGLDAGADDFLTKPFNPLEMLARVRVAERALNVQIELQHHIGDLEALAQRYNLLGELIGRQRGAGSLNTAAAQPAAPTRSSPAPAAPGVNNATSSTRLRPEEIDTVMGRALSEIGLSDFQTAPAPPSSRADTPTILAWAGLVLANEKCWIDLLLEVDVAGASEIHQAALRRAAASEQEARRFLAEVLTIVSSAFRAELSARGADILSPGLSRALHREPTLPALPLPEDRVQRAYGIGSTNLVLTIVRHPCPVQAKDPRELQVGQILASDFPPPEIDAIPLVTRGATLNERFVGKLIAYVQREGNRMLVPVFVPSVLAKKI